jgi:hypothetical protein
MPHRVLQIVASLITLAAVSSFVLGVLNAPQRGARLPGEKVPEAAGSGPAIDAQDATPLSNERIEGPPAANEAANEEDAQTVGAAGNSGAQPPAVVIAPPPPAPPPSKPPPPAGEAPEQTLGGPPAPDEPPH